MIYENFSKRSKLQDVGRWCVTRIVESVYKKVFSHCTYKAIDLEIEESRWNYAEVDYIGLPS